MDWITSSLIYVSGAASVAFVNQVASRIFGGPRVDAAIADISLSRTKHRSHKCIHVTEELRLLLAKNPTSHINWDATFISENDLDLSIIEVIQEEQTMLRQKASFDRRLSNLSAHSVKKDVYSLGVSQSEVFTCCNALIHFWPDRQPTIPQEDKDLIVYQYLRRNFTHNGYERELIQLDLPGNPCPYIGSPEGIKEINAKAAPLIYAMSYCDIKVLREILILAKDFCDEMISSCQGRRSELDRIKRETTHLEVKVLVSNRGMTPAYLSTFAEISVGNVKQPVEMSLVDDTPHGENPRWDIVIKDSARRLGDWIPTLKPSLRNYESAIQNLALGPSETLTLHFVSDSAVNDEIQDAVGAMRTGYTDSFLVLKQYIPRRMKFIPFMGRFVKKIKAAQRITSARK